MLRKLYALVSKSCCADNPDSPQHQEVLLPGTLYGMIIKERVEEILNGIRATIAADVRNGVVVDFNDSESVFGERKYGTNLILLRKIFPKSDAKSQFRHRCTFIQLSRHRELGLSYGPRSATSIRFHYRC